MEELYELLQNSATCRWWHAPPSPAVLPWPMVHGWPCSGQIAALPVQARLKFPLSTLGFVRFSRYSRVLHVLEALNCSVIMLIETLEWLNEIHQNAANFPKAGLFTVRSSTWLLATTTPQGKGMDNQTMGFLNNNNYRYQMIRAARIYWCLQRIPSNTQVTDFSFLGWENEPSSSKCHYISSCNSNFKKKKEKKSIM